MKLLLHHPVLLWLLTTVGVALSEPVVQPSETSPNQDVVFIIDGSGSVSDEDFDLQLRGLAMTIINSQIIPRDGSVSVAIVQFSSSAQVEVPLRVISSIEDAKELYDSTLQIKQIGAGTKPGIGIDKATEEFEDSFRPEAEQFYILTSDGVFDRDDDPAAAVARAKSVDLDHLAVFLFDVEKSDEPSFEEDYGDLPVGNGVLSFVKNSIDLVNSIGTLLSPVTSTRATLVGMEVVQVIQDLRNSVALVENKPTLLRAYFEPIAPEIGTFVDARLKGFDSNGVEFSDSPVVPSNNGGYRAQRGALVKRRETLDGSLNFKIPKAWLGVGEVTFAVVSGSTSIECREGSQKYGGVPNDCQVRVEFQEAPEVGLNLVRLFRSGDKGTDHDDIRAAKAEIEAIFPVSKLSVLHRGLSLDHIDCGFDNKGVRIPSTDSVCILETLTLMQEEDRDHESKTSNHFYYGLMPAGIDYNDQVGGMAYFVKSWKKDTTCVGTGIAGSNLILPHEWGHCLGRDHAGEEYIFYEDDLKNPICEASARDPGRPYPFWETLEGYVTKDREDADVPTLCKLTNLQDVNEIAYGYDSRIEQPISPFDHFSLMSYCYYQWIATHTYEKMRTVIYDRYGTKKPSSTRSRRRLDSGPVEMCMYRGIHESSSGDGYFLPVHRYWAESPLDRSYGSGSYKVIFKDAAGTVIDQVQFDPVLPKSRLQTNTKLLMIIVPCNQDVTEAALIDDQGSQIAKVAASANAPTIQIDYPNGGESLNGQTVVVRWTASDLDGDDLVFSLKFSADGGVTWTTLAMGISDSSAEVPLEDLGKTSQGMFRVGVSDGFLGSESTSAGVFSTPNNAPMVHIKNPLQGSMFTGIQLVQLMASTYDVEDGFASQVEWTSSIDDYLGTGETLEKLASDLTEGAHNITAVAKDSDGGSSQSLPIEINIKRFAALSSVSAECRDLNLRTEVGTCSAAAASVDAGSLDFGGGTVAIQQDHEGRYSFGETKVVLTALGETGDTDSCSATVTVLDEEPPKLRCKKRLFVDARAPMPSIIKSVSDNCDRKRRIKVSQFPRKSPKSGVFTATATARDVSGNAASCSTRVVVVTCGDTGSGCETKGDCCGSLLCLRKKVGKRSVRKCGERQTKPGTAEPSQPKKEKKKNEYKCKTKCWKRRKGGKNVTKRSCVRACRRWSNPGCSTKCKARHAGKFNSPDKKVCVEVCV